MTKYTVEVQDNGTKRWYQNGKIHRTDGPAVENADGDKEWYQNGKLHRTDGPAIEYAYGTKYWYQNGKIHRTDGPAIEWADGTKEWYIEGKPLSEAEFLNQTKVKAPCAGKIVEVDGVRYRLVEA
jgi:antitoxin component YwqK of YwqJK toxin-antitoxin module